MRMVATWIYVIFNHLILVLLTCVTGGVQNPKTYTVSVFKHARRFRVQKKYKINSKHCSKSCLKIQLNADGHLLTPKEREKKNGHLFACACVRCVISPWA